MSVASAGFLDGLFGSDESITIDGESFTIPAGFAYNETESQNTTSETLNSTTAYYDNSNEYVSIYVESANDGEHNETASLFDAAQNKTVSNRTGTYIEQGGECSFEYKDGDKFVSVTTNNPELLEKIIE